MHEDPDHRSSAYVHTDPGLSWSSARRALLVLTLSAGFAAISVALAPDGARRPTVAALVAPPAASPAPEQEPLLTSDIDSCGFDEACAVMSPAVPMKVARKGAAAVRTAFAAPPARTATAVASR